MRRAILGALTAPGADQLGHLGLHQLLHQPAQRLAHQIRALLRAQPLDDLTGRHALDRAIAGASFRRDVELPTIIGATGPELRPESNRGSIPPEPSRPTSSYTNTRDVTSQRRQRSNRCREPSTQPARRVGHSSTGAASRAFRRRPQVSETGFDVRDLAMAAFVGGALDGWSRIAAAASILTAEASARKARVAGLWAVHPARRSPANAHSAAAVFVG
jgi:hypothetical protein